MPHRNRRLPALGCLVLIHTLSNSEPARSAETHPASTPAPAPDSTTRPARSLAAWLAQPDAEFRTPAAAETTAHVLSWQSRSGLWPKNTDTANQPNPNPPPAAGTFDNGATFGELRFLARRCRATRDAAALAALERGLQTILRAQYPAGGWPQVYPLEPRNYSRHITFNDGAMVRVLELLRDVSHSEAFSFLDPRLRTEARTAFDRGIGCILQCQVIVDGQRTAWCAQHDETDLSPRPARRYELVSLSGSESVGIVRLLMSLDAPSLEVIQAVDTAVAWFKKVRISGLRVERRPAPDLPGGWDRVTVPDPQAPPLWARFYEIGSNRPIFAGRDGVKRYALADIEHERRTGYAWLGDWPATLLDRDYPAWKRRVTKAQP